MIELLPYQQQDLNKILKSLHKGRIRHLLTWDPGLGKTVETFALIHTLYPKRTLVVCPAGLKWNWEREARELARLRADVLEGLSPPRKYQTRRNLVVIGYNLLWAWMDWLLAWEPDFIVFDETQAIGNRKSQCSQAARFLVTRGNIKHRLGLSGTLITSRPEQVWPILNILQPALFPYFTPFGHQYCAPKRIFGHWVYSGAKNLDQLHEKMAPFTVRRRKKDVLPQLPPVHYNIIPVDIERRGYYDRADRDFVHWLAKNMATGKVKKTARAKGLAKIGYLKRLVGELKLKAVFQWIDNFLADSEDKILVGIIHKKVANAFMERYGSISSLITGSVAVKDRRAQEDRFQDDPKCQMLTGNLQAAGRGLNLTAAKTVLLAELGWTPEELTQFVGRAYGRVKDLHGVDVWVLVGRNTVEEKVLKIVQTKQKNLNAIMDGGSERGEKLNLFDALCREMMKGKKKRRQP
jgi:SNF2 family DNA or RNA helicase